MYASDWASEGEQVSTIWSIKISWRSFLSGRISTLITIVLQLNWQSRRAVRIAAYCFFLALIWKRKEGAIAIQTARLLNDRGLKTDLIVAGCRVPGKKPAFVKELGYISKRTHQGRQQLSDLLRSSNFLIFPTRAECSAVVFQRGLGLRPADNYQRYRRHFHLCSSGCQWHPDSVDCERRSLCRADLAALLRSCGLWFDGASGVGRIQAKTQLGDFHFVSAFTSATRSALVSLNTRTRRSPRILALVIFLYAASLIKFFDRDPMSPQIGLQGPIELAVLIIGALTLLVVFHRGCWKLVVTPSAKAFIAFGVIAVASSAFSFYPLLSFAKGLSFILVCGIAILATSLFGSAQVIKYLYYSILIILAIELVVKLAGGGPLLETDDYSGRLRLSLFGLHPTLLGELSGVALLSSVLLPKKPPLYCQVFLFALNIAADSRTSSTLLVVILLAIWLASLRHDLRFVSICCCIGSFLAVVVLVGIQTNYRPSADIASISRPLYGDTLATDLPSLNGRTDVWDAAAPLVAHSIFLGYGLGGGAGRIGQPQLLGLGGGRCSQCSDRPDTWRWISSRAYISSRMGRCGKTRLAIARLAAHRGSWDLCVYRRVWGRRSQPDQLTGSFDIPDHNYGCDGMRGARLVPATKLTPQEHVICRGIS